MDAHPRSSKTQSRVTGHLPGRLSAWVLAAVLAVLAIGQLRPVFVAETPGGQRSPDHSASAPAAEAPATELSVTATAAQPANTEATPAPTPEATQTPAAPTLDGRDAPPTLPAASPVEPPVLSPTALRRAATPELGRQSYHFDATVDYRRATLDVVETLIWTNLAPTAASWINLSVIPAHADSFTLTDEVTVDGVRAEVAFVRYDTNMQIAFPAPVEQGESVAIIIPFRLEVGDNDGSLGGRLTNRAGTLQFGAWFPIWSTVHGFNEVGDPQVSWNAESMVLDLTSTTALGLDAVASTGTLHPGATASHWVFEASDVRDFAFAVNPAFRVATARTSCAGQAIELRAYDGSSAPSLLRKAVRAMDRYNDWYGCYGYPTFSIARVGSPILSMEFPMMIFMGATVAERAGIVFHEVAHQWWYGLVGNDQMNEPWLDEAFAEYSAQALFGGGDSFHSTRDLDSTIYDFAQWSGPDEYLDTVYDRGAEFLIKLRGRIGTERFLAAMRDIVATYRHDVATTDGVLDIFRSAADKSIEDLVSNYGLMALR